MLTKRDFLCAATATTAAAFMPAAAAPARLIDNATPITAAERATRVAKAQGLLQRRNLSGLLIEPGPTMEYFTGIQWRRSKRLMAVVIPAEGDVGIVAPAFEERKLRAAIGDEPDVRTWEEHESPYAAVAGFLTDRGQRGALAIDPTVRFFVIDGLRRESNRRITSGETIVNNCRMLKSPAEIQLMQVANDITVAAYKKTIAAIEVGMTQSDISTMMSANTVAEGARSVFALALIGEASSYPHGKKNPEKVKSDSLILMDCGCDVYGYKSDISRTFTLGDGTAEQNRVWSIAKKGQELALNTARIGVPTGVVDDTVRAYYEREGFGPDYKTPGLSHRLGHGIGMEVHEQVNFVRGEDTPLAPGMCLSNEPGIYLPGQFGVRLEDCLYMTEDGPVLFSELSPSITQPFA